jgi:predicted ferric reductase
MPVSLQAIGWFVAYLAVAGAPLWVLLASSTPPGQGVAWDFAIGLGFAALGLMATMFWLTARFRRLTLPFGIDAIYFFHRQVALLIVLFVLLHPLILFIEEPLLVRYLKPSAPLPLLLGVVAFVAIVLMVFSSVARRALHLHYDTWRRIHVTLAVAAVAATLGHVFGIHYYVSTPGTAWMWFATAAVTTALVVYVRLVRPALLRTRPYRVTAVYAERGRARTLTVEPDGHAGFRFSAGQFAWLTWRASPFAMREHPFSFSSSADQAPRLSFTIKALGDLTQALSQVRVGERVYVDGPYGSFCPDRHVASGVALIAGGIGIAPVLSVLRTAADRGDRRPYHLVYAYKDIETLTAYAAIEELKTKINLTVTLVLSHPPPNWPGERGFINALLLQRVLPETTLGYHYFICGPGPMLALTEAALRAQGAGFNRVHVEIFDLV